MFPGGIGMPSFPLGGSENYEDDLPLPPFQEVFAFILNNPLYQYKFGNSASKKRGNKGGYDGKAKKSKDEKDIDETTGLVSHTHTHTNMHIYIFIHIHLYVHIRILLFVFIIGAGLPRSIASSWRV
ncbi:hypothetical protein EON63_07295 [archaeon]|nr:MAG: hypothetical protein EON63_07295 [archaeon]